MMGPIIVDQLEFANTTINPLPKLQESASKVFRTLLQSFRIFQNKGALDNAFL